MQYNNFDCHGYFIILLSRGVYLIMLTAKNRIRQQK